VAGRLWLQGEQSQLRLFFFFLSGRKGCLAEEQEMAIKTKASNK
jgi:hypothetical protein